LERSGPSIEVKVVLLVAAAVVVQDLLLLAMYLAGARPTTIQIVLGGLLVLAIVLAGVWGNAISRAVRRLTRACYVARKGDTGVLSGLDRTDELGELHAEINSLIEALRELSGSDSDLQSAREVIHELGRAAPELTRASHELLLCLKELREGAVAEVSIFRKVAGSAAEASAGMPQLSDSGDSARSSDEAAARLKSVGGLAREIEILADRVVDEVARPEIDEVSLARAVNGLRDAARTITGVAEQTSTQLERRRSDLAALRKTELLLGAIGDYRQDGARVAELMERSAAAGLSEATRLSSLLRRLGASLQSHSQHSRR
jgi:methyl-accepting chemotaxis protein